VLDDEPMHVGLNLIFPVPNLTGKMESRAILVAWSNLGSRPADSGDAAHLIDPEDAPDNRGRDREAPVQSNGSTRASPHRHDRMTLFSWRQTAGETAESCARPLTEAAT
jgi:hypothetical protein